MNNGFVSKKANLRLARVLMDVPDALIRNHVLQNWCDTERVGKSLSSRGGGFANGAFCIFPMEFGPIIEG